MSAPQGPEVPDHEDLYRALTNNKWYKSEEARVSSAAFAYPRISADIVSIADNQGSPPGEFTLAQFLPGTGLARLGAGQVKACGGVPRAELDPKNAANPAHAHIYMSRDNKKADKKRMAECCTVIRTPSLPQ